MILPPSGTINNTDHQTNPNVLFSLKIVKNISVILDVAEKYSFLVAFERTDAVL